MKRKLTYFILALAFSLWVSIPEMTKAEEVMLSTKHDLSDALAIEMADRIGEDSVLLTHMRLRFDDEARYYSYDEALGLISDGVITIEEISLDGHNRFKVEGVADHTGFSLSGRIEAAIEVPVAAYFLQRGAIITEEDISYKWVEARRVHRGVVMDEIALVGKQLARNIRENTPFALRSIRVPMAFKKGDLVTLTYHSGTIALSTIGEALEDAQLGKIVTLKNIDSGRIIKAMATDMRQAEVNYQAKFLEEAKAKQLMGGVRAN